MITLFRSIGLKELQLIINNGYQGFPPRLPSQPIFYPVLNEEYAIQIARDWNTKDSNSSFCGFVTTFQLHSEFLDKYEVKTVGNKGHQEYWIPAEDLETFNKNIIGPIQVTRAF